MENSRDEIKKQDFGEWVNIQLYKDIISTKCKGKLGINEISTLANMFAIIFAMKARDYVNYKIDKSPGDIETDAKRCADNLYAYLQNYPAIKNNWLELFVIGYAGESLALQNKEQEYGIKIEPSNDVEDDEYALQSALFVSRLDKDLTENQQRQIALALLNRTEKRKQIVKKRLEIINAKNRWQKLAKSIFKKKTQKEDRKKQNTYKLLTLNYVLKGVLTSTGMIISIKLFPAYGFFTLITGGTLGYLSSSPISSGALKLRDKIFTSKNIEHTFSLTSGSSVHQLTKEKKIYQKVTQSSLPQYPKRNKINEAYSNLSRANSPFLNKQKRSDNNFEELLNDEFLLKELEHENISSNPAQSSPITFPSEITKIIKDYQPSNIKISRAQKLRQSQQAKKKISLNI